MPTAPRPRCCATLIALSLAAASVAADDGGTVVAAAAPQPMPAGLAARPHASTIPTAPQSIEVRGSSQDEASFLDSDPFGVASSMHPIGFACHVDPSQTDADGPDPFWGRPHAMLVVKMDASEPVEAPMTWWR